jgi:adenine-specific DNA-methyltransferase
MEKVSQSTDDRVQSNIDAIAGLFPNVVTESFDSDGNIARAIDFDRLRQEFADHVVDGPRERYQLDWPGKRAAALAANAPTRATLRPKRDESVDFDTTRNLFIEGDNLEALKLLQESYLGKVKLIYIDPPYNTGNDFIYEDDFAETTAEYLERSGQTDETGARLVANTEANGRFHSDWLSMMLPRLRLARNLLREDGIICISIDDAEVGALRLICDSVFGEANFVAQVIWQKRTSPEARKRIAAGHEYILMYCRSSEGVEHALLPLPLEESDRVAFTNPDNDSRGPWVSSDFTAPGFRPNQMYTIQTPTGSEVSPPPGRCWMNIESEYLKQSADGRFWFGPDGRGIPRRKTYLSERNGKSAWTWWPNSEVGHTQEATKEVRALFDKEGPALFDFPKPVRLLQRIVQLATSATDNCIVLDFFAGSGSTAHAVLSQNAVDGGNRRWILVQLAEPIAPGHAAAQAGYRSIADLSRERVRRAATKVRSEAGLTAEDLDTGFRALAIDSSSFVDVLRTPDDTDQVALDVLADNIKADRSGEDLLLQVMLDWGLPLSLPIDCQTMHDVDVLDVDDGGLIACFATVLSSELVRSIAERRPVRAVFRDSSFGIDAERINVEQIFREVSKDTQVKVI